MPFSLPSLLTAGFGRALPESRQREPRQDRAAEEGGRLVARKAVHALHDIVDAALAKRSGRAFELCRRIVNEAGGLGHLVLNLARRSVYRARDSADLFCSRFLLLLR